MKKIPALLFALCILVPGYSGLAYSQVVNTFLHLEGIEGEAVAAGHENEIEVLSWSWQMSATNYAMHAGGYGGVDKAIVRPVIINKLIDKASPLISISLLKGISIPEAVLRTRKSGADPFDFARITMKPVRIVHQSVESDGTVIYEKVALSFGSICYQYTPQKADGTPDAIVERCWSLEANQEF